MFSMKIGNGKGKNSKPKKPTAFSFKSSTDKPPSKSSKPSNALSKVFGNLDSEQEASSNRTGQSLKSVSKKKKTQRELAKAFQEDPSVFQYDELYDSFQEKRDAAFREKEIEKTLRPVRYLDTIQKVAEKRQIRYDAAKERLLLKERKSTDHLFEDKEKYITRAYREKLKEIEEQRLKDKEQSEKEKTVRDEEGMNSFFKGYLQKRTGGIQKEETNGIKKMDKKHSGNSSDARNEQSNEQRSRSRSRSRERGRESKRRREDRNELQLDEEERYHIEKYQQELRKKTFDDQRQKHLESLAIKKCEKRTTKSDIEKLRERYLKRKQRFDVE